MTTERIEELEGALKAVRRDIMRSATSVIWHTKKAGVEIPETAVDFITGMLGDDWDHDQTYERMSREKPSYGSSMRAKLIGRCEGILAAYDLDNEPFTLLTIRDDTLTTEDLQTVVNELKSGQGFTP